jgi:lipid-binding SYLF domain-containing protein
MKSMLRAFILLLVSIPLIARAQVIDGDLDHAAAAALNALYASSPAARVLAETAKGVLVFPDVRTSSLVEGAQAGDGVMFSDGKIAGYYSVGGLEADMEAGAQSCSYALFFMSDVALERVNDPDGLDIGRDPNIVIFDVAQALMIGGASLRGQTITQLDR